MAEQKASEILLKIMEDATEKNVDGNLIARLKAVTEQVSTIENRSASRYPSADGSEIGNY